MRRPRPPLAPRRRLLAGPWSLFPRGQPERAQDVRLPCQWQTVDAFARELGPFVYRLRFRPPPWRRVRLVCGGAFTDSLWRLNGRLLGHHRGAVGPVRFDLGPYLRPGENALEVEVASPPAADAAPVPIGVFGRWDCLPPHVSPGGIWRPVHLEAAAPADIASLWLTTERIGGREARVRVHVRAEAERAGRHRLALRLVPPGRRRAVRARLTLDLPAGRSVLDLPLTVPAPLVWEPWSRTGRPRAHLYTLSAALTAPGGGTARRAARVGLRTVAVDGRGRLCVNGRPLFVKGWNYGPSSAHLAQSGPALCRTDVEGARALGLNALRVHAHLDHPALYAAADRAGMLLFQDGPLQWTYPAAVFPDAAVELSALLERLAPHPSVVWLWAHNEPVDVTGAGAGRGGPLARLRSLASTLVWSDNRDVWDRALVAALPRGPDGRHPGGVHVARHSGVVARRRGEDSHLYMGWYPEFGPLAALDLLLALAPGLARWVTEFGAQSVPVPESARRFMPDRPTDADWRRLAAEHMAQPELLERRVGIAGLDLALLAERTQAYQAALHGAFIDRLRSRMGRPTAGFFGFLWADAAPGVTWAVLDAWRQPKLAHHALADQLRPLAAVALLPLSAPWPRRTYRVPVVVVNDTGWRTRVAVRARIADRPLGAWAREVDAEAALTVAAPAVPGHALWREGALHVDWQVEPLAGEGPPPADGERVYALPSPLWRRRPPP
ncbi:MAG: hypothetical protein K6V73_04730 [Firmicutes bacterium]|nr:hypothetical protein [Bacillota bacterium]